MIFCGGGGAGGNEYLMSKNINFLFLRLSEGEGGRDISPFLTRVWDPIKFATQQVLYSACSLAC